MLGTLGSLAYHWIGLNSWVKHFVLSCKAWSISKRGIKAPKAELKSIPPPQKPFQVLSCDVWGPVTKSKAGNTAVLTVMDTFSRFCWLKPLKECTSENIARELFNVFCDTGIPKVLIADNATNLTSKVMEELTQILGIKKVHVAPYITRGNAMIERMHLVIGNSLRTLLSENNANFDEWDLQLPKITFALRAAVSADSEVSPFEIIHGEAMTLPIQRLLQAEASAPLTQPTAEKVSEYTQNLKQ